MPACTGACPSRTYADMSNKRLITGLDPVCIERPCLSDEEKVQITGPVKTAAIESPLSPLLSSLPSLTCLLSLSSRSISLTVSCSLFVSIYANVCFHLVVNLIVMLLVSPSHFRLAGDFCSPKCSGSTCPSDLPTGTRT